MLITDRAMPQMNGVQLAGAVKGINPQFPVLLVSGDFSLIDENGAQLQHIDYILPKPVNARELRQAITRLGNGRQGS